MSENIGTAREMLHEKCGKGIVRVINGIPHVECVRKGCREWVPLNGFVERDPLRQAIDLLMSGQVSPQEVSGLANLDPFAAYRGIEGLICIGPAELDKACRSLDPNNLNPLGLQDGWVPRLEPTPREDAWIRSRIWRDDPSWKTRMALVTVPASIAGIPTSLIGQNKIWGVPHDGVRPGIVRQDVFWGNFFVQPDYDWANEPAVADWRLLFIYEHLLWTTNLNWVLQQQAVREKGMPISTAAQDTFTLNVIRAATGIQFRKTTWARTSTIFDGLPLIVYSHADGVGVDQYWLPEGAGESIAASAQGVPRDFEA